MPAKLDLTDRKLLYHLDFDARQSLKQLGKKVNLSPEAVAYRIKKLERSVIRDYNPMINFGSLGYFWQKLFLKFDDFSRKNEREIVSYLKQKDEVKWIVTCHGSWDMILTIMTESYSDFVKVKDDILTTFSSIISQSVISSMVDGLAFRRAYLTGGKHDVWQVAITPEKKPVIDRLDRDILKKLSENGRMHVSDIASALKKESKTIAYRLNRLKRDKIFLGTRITLDYKRFDHSFFKCLIKLKKLDRNTIRRFESFCHMNPNCLHYMKVNSTWDLEPEFELKSNEEFFDLVRDIRDRFSGVIHSVDSLIISDEYRYRYF